MKSFIIGGNDCGQRVDKFLSKAVPLLPKNLMYKYLRLKRIKRNGKRCEISDRLLEGDKMELYINDEFFGDAPKGDYPFLAAPSVLIIVYEDENVIFVDKRPGLVVHEDEGGDPDTLINRILHYLYDKKEYDPAKELSFVPALCNRIDRNTGGIVLAAKNAEALRSLNEKVKNRDLLKQYLAVVHGTPDPKADRAVAYMEKDENKKLVTVTDRPGPGKKTMITEYRTLEEKNGLALIEVDLITGRTHQIRAHMAHLGHPLLGDGKYGSNALNKGSGFRYQALYAYRITFDIKGNDDILTYLDGKTFEVKDVWFCRELGFHYPVQKK